MDSAESVSRGCDQFVPSLVLVVANVWRHTLNADQIRTNISDII